VFLFQSFGNKRTNHRGNEDMKMQSFIGGALSVAVAMFSLVRGAQAAPFAYITNYENNTVSIIDTATDVENIALWRR
jgi:hypothetical protein